MKRRTGFTLIELLVVIAIIALLVSILMPSLQKAKDMAKNVVCMSHQRNVGYGIFLYAEQSDDQYPIQLKMDKNAWQGDKFTNPLSWDVRIGTVPFDQIPENLRDDQMPGFPRSMEICMEGFVDFNFWDRKDGTFKCPAFYEQVAPFAPLRWGPATTSTVLENPDSDPREYLPAQQPTMAVGGNSFAMNSSLCPTFHPSDDGDKGFKYPDGEEPYAVKTTDVRGTAVMIGDVTIRQGGSQLLSQSTFILTMTRRIRSFPISAMVGFRSKSESKTQPVRFI